MKTVLTPSQWILITLSFLLTLGLLTACGGTTPQGELQNEAPEATQPALSTDSLADLRREDSQGAVTVQVTPLNLDQSANTLDFNVVMNTHSVDLSMDLAQLALLRTDTSLEVQANAWPVGSGHHYEGTLSFPAQTPAGQSLLKDATKLILIIKDVDAPERLFEWELPK